MEYRRRHNGNPIFERLKGTFLEVIVSQIASI